MLQELGYTDVWNLLSDVSAENFIARDKENEKKKKKSWNVNNCRI